MIASAAIDSVTWKDVESFCAERVQEGATLDYKRDFPANLERTIAAMANTLGGIILIGVDEDDQSRPVLPILGMPRSRGLAERVIAIALSNLTPPLIPEVQVCPNSDSSSAIVLIRVAQSPLGPHAISASTKVYLRTGSLTTPDELATVDQIQWLVDKRRKSVSLRDALHEQFEVRYSQFYYRVIDRLMAGNIDASETTHGILDLRACPTFPVASFRTPSQMANIYPAIAVPEYYGTARNFPPGDTYSQTCGPTILQDGVAFVNSADNGKRIFYAELNSLGFYGFRQPIRRDEQAPSGIDAAVILRASEIVVRIDEFLASAHRFYGHIGYRGFVDLDVAVFNIKEIGLRFDWYESAWASDFPHGTCPDEEVHFADTLPQEDLLTRKDDLLFESSRKICWAFGIDLMPAHLEAMWKKVNRHTG